MPFFLPAFVQPKVPIENLLANTTRTPDGGLRPTVQSGCVTSQHLETFAKVCLMPAKRPAPTSAEGETAPENDAKRLHSSPHLEEVG